MAAALMILEDVGQLRLLTTMCVCVCVCVFVCVHTSCTHMSMMQRLLKDRLGARPDTARWTSEEEDLCATTLPALLAYARSAVLSCVSRVEERGTTADEQARTQLRRACRDLVIATYAAILDEGYMEVARQGGDGGRVSDDSGSVVCDLISLFFNGLSARFLPVSTSTSSVLVGGTGDRRLSETGPSAPVEPREPRSSSPEPFVDPYQRPPSPEAISPMVPQKPRQQSTSRQLPAFLAGLRVNPSVGRGTDC
jgi:hypothetical protein